MTPEYRDDYVQAFCADSSVLLADEALALPPVAVVLTDPPYVFWAYIEDIKRTLEMSLIGDIRWQAEVFAWASEWIWPMRGRLTDDAALWLFCDLNYLGFYQRWVWLIGAHHTRLFKLAGDEYLLYASTQPLGTIAAERVGSALLRHNRYGQGKSVEMLRAILAASPQGHVLDPFMGTGSTLLAARAEGRTATGVEMVGEAFAATVERLRAADGTTSVTMTRGNGEAR